MNYRIFNYRTSYIIDRDGGFYFYYREIISFFIFEEASYMYMYIFQQFARIINNVEDVENYGFMCETIPKFPMPIVEMFMK